MQTVNEEMELNDYRISNIQNSLVKGSKILRVFKYKCKDITRVSHKYEVHYINPSSNEICKTTFSARGRHRPDHE